jgi:two-component system nitrogen regulation sensor histidine kinase NtrY
LKYNLTFGILCIATWLGGLLLSQFKKDDGYFTNQTQKIERSLREKEEVATAILPRLAADIHKYPKEQAFEIYGKYQEELSKHPDIHVYGYYNDSLIFWTSGSVLVPYLTFDEDFIHPVAKMKNGWYRFIKFTKDSLEMLALIHIKNEFAISNQYLNKDFNPSFKVKESANLYTQPTASAFAVNDAKGKFLFSIEYKKKDRNTIIYETTASVFYFLSILCLLIFFYTLRGYQFFKDRKHLYVTILIACIVLCRFICVRYQCPGLLYKQPVFSPELFASSAWLPSLGDFILHAIGLTFIIFGVALTYQSRRINAQSKSLKKYIYLLLLTFISAFSGWGVAFLFEKLVLDSNISFDLSNLLVLNLYSFLGFSLITFLLLNFLVIVYALCRQIVRSRVIGFYEAIVFYSIAYIVFGLVVYREGVLNLVPPVILYLLNISVLNINYKRKQVFNFYVFAPIIFLFTIFSTYTLFILNKSKEQAHRQNLAFKISDEQDYITEYLFTETVEELKNDQIVKQLLFDGEVRIDNEVRYPNELFDRIAKKYFGGYYTKYSLRLTPFSIEDYALLGTENADKELEDYEDAIEFNGKNTSSPDLFFIDNNYGKVNYIGRIEFIKQNPDLSISKKYLYIEFISKIVTQVTGFPQLLLDDKITKPADLSGYSYAIYKGNKLTVFGGDFVYPLKSQEFVAPLSDVEYITKSGYNHLVYRTPSGKIIVVSKKNSSLQEFFSPFAYMLIYFSAILLFYILYRFLILRDRNSFQINFKTRIQVSILFILLVSLLVVGLGINNYVITQFNKKNKLNLQEKSNSILLEFKTRIEGMPDEDVNPEYIEYVLGKLSNIFFTDINFYYANGNLMASSRESVYNEGFLSRQMNPKAFEEMTIHQQAFYMQSERIGSFDYLSVYAVFRNNSNGVVGYINLPYFLRQKELKEDLASSLLSMINVFSILIAISMIVTFIIASRLTEPLTILQEKLGQIRLGRKNEIIDYTKNDEIGSLVNEYNRMIIELEKSADLLAKSEREIAWREMAKQVAHEVKNPLTPMKLSVQYLLKAWDDKQPDFEDRLRRFKDAMIQQIEALSNIASEFSYFAKMPVAIRQEADVAELLSSCLDFYEENEGDVKIEFINLLPGKKAIVLLDKDQILRVFNNIIRNAIQSIPSDRIGEIYIELKEEGNKYIISVQDNGMGIPEDIKDKIFSPNFTTKNSGMGLGLAMTKTILENMDGNIYFDTRQDEGTTFYIELNKLTVL